MGPVSDGREGLVACVLQGAASCTGLGAVPAMTSRRGSVFTAGATLQACRFLRQVLGKGREGLEHPVEHVLCAWPTLQTDHSRLGTHSAQ